MSEEAYLTAILQTYRPRPKRARERFSADLNAGVRPRGSTRFEVRLTDLSTHGCGFHARWPIGIGRGVWLSLPGLEGWEGKVVWFDDERGGIEFVRPLHPSVVAHLTADMVVPNCADRFFQTI